MSVQSREVTLAGLCAAVLLTAGSVVQAQDQQQMMDRIKELEKKVADLEGISTSAVMQASIPSKTLDFLGQTEISGFVSASYIYDFSRGSKTSPGTSPTVAGRLFDANNNSFTINKFKLALEKPVNQTADKWDAGYRADLIFGQDAALTHSSGMFGGFNSGQDIDLEQAFVDFNVPIGNGLKVIVGKTVTLMGLEVIEEVANPNWSVGNQFIYVENFTQTGVQLAYKWNDKIDTEFVVFNGWDQVPDNNSSKSFMGRIGWAIDDKESIGLIGYGGTEQALNNHDWRSGAEVLFNRKWTDKLNSWIQLDYGHEDHVDINGNQAEWCAGGLWLTYDFTEKVQLAFRGDYLRDKDGVRAVGSGGTVPVAGPAAFTDAPKELSSATLTLNYKPVANLQIRPELRLDHSATDTALNGKGDQVTGLIGVAYLY